MIRKLIKRVDDLKEFYGYLKYIYQNDTLEVINFNKIISIDNQIVILQDLTIEGSNLKIIYQDPVKIIIKGDITKLVMKNGENGI